MLTAHLTAGHVDPVLHQQIEYVAQDADAVLAVDFDTHEKAQTVKDEANGRDFSASALR
jgi:hypothetical protein